MYRYTALHTKRLMGACVICDNNPISVGFLCQDCDKALPSAAPFLVDHQQKPLTVLPAYRYGGIVGRAIGTFKDDDNVFALPILVHSVMTLAERLGDYIADGRLPANSMILPVPTTKARLASRGSYTVGILAQYLATASELPLYTGVVRTIDGTHQRGLGRDERLVNVAGAFWVQALPSVSSLIIFDDVITTGATVSAIADALWEIDPTLQIMAACLAHGN